MLPAPFGPINPIKSFYPSYKLTIETAAKPPKFLVNFFTSNKLIYFSSFFVGVFLLNFAIKPLIVNSFVPSKPDGLKTIIAINATA